MPMQEKPPVIQPGQKLRGKKHNTIFVVKKINGNEIELVSEDGTASMRIQWENLTLLDLEPIYD
jgi:hypothetical protein